MCNRYLCSIRHHKILLQSEAPDVSIRRHDGRYRTSRLCAGQILSSCGVSTDLQSLQMFFVEDLVLSFSGSSRIWTEFSQIPRALYFAREHCLMTIIISCYNCNSPVQASGATERPHLILIMDSSTEGI